MKVEVGDKLLCKKSNDEQTFHVGVEEGKWYDVVDASKLPKELTGLFPFTQYIQVNDGESVLNFSFSMTKGESYIWDYFYRNTELRKKKIEKLNNL